MIERLIGKNVSVIADGLRYKGILVEVSETSVELQAEEGWISLPMEKISSIQETE